MSAAGTFKLGVTLYSFTTEFYSFKWSFEDCMQKAAQLGPGQGVEIVGPQHHRGFPYVPKEFERIFKSSVQRNGVIPSSYGSYADAYFWADRDFTPDEYVEYTIPQLEGAARLGFPTVRLQYNCSPAVERLLPYAKRYKVKMGYELHSPLMFENPECQALIKQVKRLSSEYLGLIPDCSIFERYTMPGMAPSPFPPSDPRLLKDIMPYVIHVHGKFHRVVNGEVPDVPYEAIVRALVEGGYKGFVSTEFEGGDLGSYPDSFEVVKAQQAVLRKYLTKYGNV
jgi:sugar phosphate isomerase/epimerase